jgi:hypothetical protein
LFGPSLKEQIQKVIKKYEEQIRVKEEISFFRMEYFLYLFRKISHLIQKRNEVENNSFTIKRAMD